MEIRTTRRHLNLKSHSSPKVNVWGGLTCSVVIGFYYFEEDAVKADHYLKMLKECLKSHLKRKLVNNFRHDGAPQNYALKIRKFLVANFKD